jgi:hypothetical protein
VSAKNCLIKDIQKGNRELFQENHRLEAHVKELNDELMRTYRSCDMKSDFLDDAHTQLKTPRMSWSLLRATFTTSRPSCTSETRSSR